MSILAAVVATAVLPTIMRYLDAVTGSYRLFANATLAVILLLLVCALLFAVLDLALYRLERLQSPWSKDHVRRCLLLYVGIVLAFGIVFATPNLQTGMLQYDLTLTVCTVAAYGILVDAAVVYLKRRLDRPHPGAVT